MILDVLFPNRCINCSRIIDHSLLVCNICFSQIRFSHFDYSGENILKERCRLLFPVENAYALLQFEEESISRKIIHQLKYQSREKIGKMLAEWTYHHLQFKNEKPDIIVSVPLHPKKQRQRGYNQLHRYTEKLSEFYDIPFQHNLIKRNQYSKPQALKDKKRRLENQNVFSLTEPISNQHILLVDDVLTTGNTLSMIAWEILTSGNNKVSILVMAMEE